MHTAKQFSVALVNKPGRLAAVLTALSKEKVGTRAFSVMDSGTRGVLRMVPDDPGLAKSALEKANVHYDETDVLMVEVSKESGGLPRVCRRLAEEHVNIEYAYGSLNSPVGAKGGSLAAIKINDPSRARQVLGIAAGSNSSRAKKGPGRRPAYAR
jgi:hypothetical protein